MKNPLKEYPNHFANGRFKVKIKGFTNLKIQRYDCENNLFTLDVIHNEKKPKNCTLIARKIEDMTDEELYSYMGADEGFDRNELIRNAKMNASANTYHNMADLDLLSIGVYPFDQSHFGETVININEI